MASELDTRAEASPPDADRAPPPRRHRVLALAVPVVLVVVAGVLRFALLDSPSRIYFDETYYAADAAMLLAQGVEDGFVVHPSIGKWLIAIGIALFGDGPFGWRASSALLGTATVLFTYLAGLRLFRSVGLAGLAGLLVAFDGLAFTISRISMLDAALAAFVVLGFWLLLIDRDRQWRAVPATSPAAGSGAGLPARSHGFRWLAGLAFGIALAVKWSAILPIGAAGLFVLGSELAFRRRTTGSMFTGLGRVVASGVGTLVLLPLVVYVASYAGWFANFAETRPGERLCEEEGICEFDLGLRVSSWVDEQRQIAGFHQDLDADHQYRANASTWPLMQRPVAYYYESCSEERAAEDEADEEEPCSVAPGNVGHIVGMGNPLFWWMALGSYPLLLFGLVYRREWATAAIGVFLLGQYLPWLITSRPVFLFYVVPIVPFMALSLAWASGFAARARVLRWVPGIVAVLAAIAFAYWHPVFVGTEIPMDAWQDRMWSDEWI